MRGGGEGLGGGEGGGGRGGGLRGIETDSKGQRVRSVSMHTSCVGENVDRLEVQNCLSGGMAATFSPI